MFKSVVVNLKSFLTYIKILSKKANHDQKITQERMNIVADPQFCMSSTVPVYEWFVKRSQFGNTGIWSDCPEKRIFDSKKIVYLLLLWFSFLVRLILFFNLTISDSFPGPKQTCPGCGWWELSGQALRRILFRYRWNLCNFFRHHQELSKTSAKQPI